MGGGGRRWEEVEEGGERWRKVVKLERKLLEVI